MPRPEFATRNVVNYEIVKNDSELTMKFEPRFTFRRKAAPMNDTRSCSRIERFTRRAVGSTLSIHAQFLMAYRVICEK